MSVKKTWIQRFINVVNNPKIIVLAGMDRFPSAFPAEYYIKTLYHRNFGKFPNLKTPQTFNEKLNWLKLHDRNPQYSIMADKFRVKDYVSKKIGEEYVVPCYGHWERLEDINFDTLPEKCFIKTNHNSIKGVLVDKSKGIPYDQLKELFSNENLHRNYYWPLREWVYKDITPCILAEKYLNNDSGKDLQDYKFWCFNGKPIYMYITNKGKFIQENFYDMEFNPVNINHGFPRRIPEFEKPHNFELMQKLASSLSKNIPFIRVDFYEIGNHVYFGEFTFYDWGGMQPFVDEYTDVELGKLIKLPL